MPEAQTARFSIWRRNPVTGQVLKTDGSLALNLTRLEVCRFFARGSYEKATLETFGVELQGNGFIRTGEEFLEDNPELAVLAAWTAGAPAARGARQQRLHDEWPNLAMALDNLGVNYDA